MNTESSHTEALPADVLVFLWRYVWRRAGQFGSLLLLIIGAAGCAVAVQYGMKLLVDAMADGADSAQIWAPFMLFIAFIVVENLLWRLGGYLGCRTVVASCADLRIDLFHHLTGHPMGYFAGHFAGALANRIASAGSVAGYLYSGLAWKIIPPCVDFIGAAIVLFSVQLSMGIGLLGSVTLVALLITLMGLRGRARHLDYATQAAQVSGEIVDQVANVWTIKAFCARERERCRLERAIGVEARAQRRSWLHLEKVRVVHDACMTVMAGAMLGWALWQWQLGRISPGDVVMVSALTFRILHGSRDLALALVDASQQLGVIAETLQIIVQPHALQDPPQELHAGRGSIRFVDVCYRHADGREAFEHLFLDIPAGQKVGIVGPSGSGKSTLINLLQRLDDVSAGAILIDGRDIRSVSQDSLRWQVAVVPQEPALFNRSIRENIGYGRPDASAQQIAEAARNACCEDFIHALPEGFDTRVGERGVLLSGGQRQRLGLARAFLKNAPILILDEATSALDSESEAMVQLALQQLMQGRTVLAVAHRLSTVAGFDRILVVQDGQVIEDGPPDALHRRAGRFRMLCQAQGMELDIFRAG